MDVTDDKSVKDSVKSVLENAGRIDILVNNAGYSIAGALEETNTDEARQLFETNFFGVLRVIQAVLPSMRRHGYGRIINISSMPPAEEAGPFMCAGVTVYNALRNSGARAGDLVAVQGIGGLGHLGVQYARQMGFKTVALGRGKDKEPLAKKLGAHHYIDSDTDDAAAELQKLGGARVILATAPNAKAISALVDGLSTNGKLVVPAAPADPLIVSVMPLIMGSRSVAGWYSGTAKDSQDTLEFSALADVHPMIEKYPLSRVAEAYEQMHSGKVRFRVVLTMSS